MAERSEGAAPSPLPYRSYAAQQQLTLALLELDTVAERLTYLFDHASVYYQLRGDPVVDPDEIERLEQDATPGFQRFTARVPQAAGWVRAHTGLPLADQALHNFKGGVRNNTRPAIIRALAEFWRIHHSLLDPSVPATEFDPPQDETGRKTHALMNELGLLGVSGRDVTSSLGDAPDAAKQQLLAALEQIAEHQRGHRRGHSA